MPLLFPNVAKQATPCYLGWLERTRDASTLVRLPSGGISRRGPRPRFTGQEIIARTGRGLAAFDNYKRDPDTRMARDMPASLSAYMQLFDGAHPTYLMLNRHTGEAASTDTMPLPIRRMNGEAKTSTTRGQYLAGTGKARTLADTNRDKLAMYAWLTTQGVTEDEVREAFVRPDGVLIKMWSPLTCGHDPVDWFMLQLMCDVHPEYVLAPK